VRIVFVAEPVQLQIGPSAGEDLLVLHIVVGGWRGEGCKSWCWDLLWHLQCKCYTQQLHDAVHGAVRNGNMRFGCNHGNCRASVARAAGVVYDVW
jgi:hypothetical protein